MKKQRKIPPPAIGSERVVAYAYVDSSLTYTGTQRLFVGDQRLGPVPCVAIGKSLNKTMKDFCILYCDKNWNALGFAGAASFTAARAEAERCYQGISSQFVRVANTERAVRKWMVQEHPDATCSFCRRLYFETDAMFEANKVRVCSHCVASFSSQLEVNLRDSD
jgi:hypothetical protein